MLSDNACNNCQWFVEETEEIGDFKHSKAVSCGKGFCLIQDLFTEVTPDTPACKFFKQASDDIIRYR